MLFRTEIRADKIRQLRAENDLIKKQVTVFDPTEIKGAGFLDEMSYLEMKIRLANEKERVEREEADRRERILIEKGMTSLTKILRPSSSLLVYILSLT